MGGNRVEHAAGGGKGVGDRGATSHHGDGDGPREAKTGGGIDDVGKTHAANFDELLRVARGGDSGVNEDESRPRGGCVAKGRKLDGPAAFAGGGSPRARSPLAETMAAGKPSWVSRLSAASAA